MQIFSANIQDRILVLVKSILEQNAIAAEVNPESRLVDVGLTSMDMVNLMLGVEIRVRFYNSTIPDHAGEFPVGQGAGTDDRSRAQTWDVDLTGSVRVVFGLAAEKPRCLKAGAALEVGFIATMGFLTILYRYQLLLGLNFLSGLTLRKIPKPISENRYCRSLGRRDDAWQKG